MSHYYMEYLKYNCHDMARQSAELQRLDKQMRAFADELSAVFLSLDPRIKSYGDIAGQTQLFDEALYVLSSRLSRLYHALETTIDIYYEAERSALRLNEALPVRAPSAVPPAAPRAEFKREVSASVVNSPDLILEDWLMKLMYQ